MFTFLNILSITKRARETLNQDLNFKNIKTGFRNRFKAFSNPEYIKKKYQKRKRKRELYAVQKNYRGGGVVVLTSGD